VNISQFFVPVQFPTSHVVRCAFSRG
jgi:hypothetical protein